MISTTHSFFKKNYRFFEFPLIVISIIAISPFISSTKFFDPYTTMKWLFILLSVNGLLFIFLHQKQYLIIPTIPKHSFNVLLIIFFLSLVNIYLHNIFIFSFENMRRTIFWGLSIFFFNLFFLEKDKLFNNILNAIHCIAFLFLLCSYFFYVSLPNNFLHFTFGNIAHSAEYVGLCTALQFGSLTHLWKKNKKSLFLNILSASSLAYIFLSHSRATAIGTIFILLAAVALNKKNLKEIAKILLFSAVFILLINSLKSYMNPVESAPFIAKDYTERWLLYISTLKMIFENPLGVGVGQYEFASIPYLKSVSEFNESTIFSTPHNDFLHILAEDGIILSLFLFYFLLSLIYFLWNEIKRIFYSYPEFIYFSLILLPLATFQFPLANPFPYLMSSMMIGYFFALRTEEYFNFQLTKKLKLVLVGVNLIAALSFVSTFGAKYVAYNFPKDQFANKVACSIGNRNWLSCLNVASSYLDEKEYEKAETYVLRTLNWQPLNYQSIRMLGFISLYKGNTKKACELFKAYSLLFREPTLVGPVIEEKCINQKLNNINL